MALPARPYQALSPAPWAEVVPDRGPATVDDLLTLPDHGYSYEVMAELFRDPLASDEKARR